MTEAAISGGVMWRAFTTLALFFIVIMTARLLRNALENAAMRWRGANKVIRATTLLVIARSLGILAFATVFRSVPELVALPDTLRAWTVTVANVVMVCAVAYLLYRAVDIPDVWLTQLAAGTKSKLDDLLVPMVRKTLRTVIVVLALAQIAQLLSDKPLSSIIASLGIGGLAIALAAQETLKNFFGSLVLLADKPFELGDRINVDNLDGIIETVGLRSTRIRTLDGHLVTFPNGELANKTIVNISKRPFIRRIMDLAIPYDTPPEKVERAIQIVKEVLNGHEGMKPDLPPRVYFAEFAPAALNLRAIYWYHPPDYWSFMAFSERVNLELVRRFNAEGIEFAFPTQTVYLAADRKRPLFLHPAEGS